MNTLSRFYYNRTTNVADCIAFYKANHGRPTLRFYCQLVAGIIKGDLPDYYELDDTMDVNPYMEGHN